MTQQTKKELWLEGFAPTEDQNIDDSFLKAAEKSAKYFRELLIQSPDEKIITCYDDFVLRIIYRTSLCEQLRAISTDPLELSYFKDEAYRNDFETLCVLADVSSEKVTQMALDIFSGVPFVSLRHQEALFRRMIRKAYKLEADNKVKETRHQSSETVAIKGDLSTAYDLAAGFEDGSYTPNLFDLEPVKPAAHIPAEELNLLKIIFIELRDQGFSVEQIISMVQEHGLLLIMKQYNIM